MSEEVSSQDTNNEEESLVSATPLEIVTAPTEESLPQDTVHCFPHRASVILRRRLISMLLSIGSAVGIVYSVSQDPISYLFLGACGICLIVCIIVFSQSFLISQYRVAIDYGKKEVVLRYQFQKIRIAFENFDTKAGAPDRREQIMEASPLHNGQAPIRYLILDDIKAEACYQTTSKDLASISDFNQLKDEVTAIRAVYRADDEEVLDMNMTEEEKIDKIIKTALEDEPKNIDE